MRFLNLFHKSSQHQHNFDNIHGYEDIKDVVGRASDADENYNLLFVGAPASSKTMFLMEI
jgi:hypothetical protein